MLPPINQTVSEPFHKRDFVENAFAATRAAQVIRKNFDASLASQHAFFLRLAINFDLISFHPASPEWQGRRLCTHLARSPTKISFHGFIFAQQQRACCFGATEQWLRIQRRVRRWPLCVLQVKARFKPPQKNSQARLEIFAQSSGGLFTGVHVYIH
jgi:hypothetical protein